MELELERLLQLPYWTWSTPSFALPGRARGAGAAAATTVLDVVYAFLRAARWRLG